MFGGHGRTDTKRDLGELPSNASDGEEPGRTQKKVTLSPARILGLSYVSLSFMHMKQFSAFPSNSRDIWTELGSYGTVRAGPAPEILSESVLKGSEFTTLFLPYDPASPGGLLKHGKGCKPPPRFRDSI